MTGVQFLACVWTLVITQTVLVLSDIQFLERYEGDSVVLPCVIQQNEPPPFGMYLSRSWLQQSQVLYIHTKSVATVANDDDQTRIGTSGDPSSHSLNVTISELRVSDTDRYYCDFVVHRPLSEDERIHGDTEFVLLVTAAAHGSLDIGLIETYAGGAAVLPCLPPNGEGLAVEGVSLKRQRGRAPVEMLYNSKRHHGSSSSSSSSSSQFSTGRVQLSSAPGPGGLTYNLTLQQLQPEESALYSCQLLVRGRADNSSSLGRHVFFVSVQGRHCGCSSYSTLLYALSSAVAVLLLLLLLIGFLAIHKGKARRSVKARPQVPIYEEMTGVKPLARKVAPHHLEEMESSEYRNCSVKKLCPENHYESPASCTQNGTE
ncbi:cd7 antigen-like [Hippoglossus hippoglossus]|uniref:cd7 antigen-like n=1 Tax=Hippoglossus hippoglossus TaxID=8267 RepID=UPI00148C1DAB|nr:cd7 antigen-like [Hippoglossus hippoglossus]